MRKLDCQKFLFFCVFILYNFIYILIYVKCGILSLYTCTDLKCEDKVKIDLLTSVIFTSGEKRDQILDNNDDDYAFSKVISVVENQTQAISIRGSITHIFVMGWGRHIHKYKTKNIIYFLSQGKVNYYLYLNNGKICAI